MSLAKIVAQLVERGEEDLAEELLSVAAPSGPSMDHVYVRTVFLPHAQYVVDYMKKGDARGAARELGQVLDFGGAVAQEIGLPPEIKKKMQTLGKKVMAAAKEMATAGLKDFELVGADPKFMAKQAQRAWPNVTYHGKSVFDAYIKGSGWKKLHNAALKARTFEGEPDDVQECYLGYLPKSDMFLCGFDAWKNAKMFSGRNDAVGYVWVTFQIANGQVTRIMGAGGDIEEQEEGAGSFTFYPRGYKEVHKDNRDLIDLRLD